MNIEFTQFLINFNLERRQGSMKKELTVKTPFNAIEKWFSFKPELFKINPSNFKNKSLICIKLIFNFYHQLCEI